jgi:hypothetical protein
MEKALERLRLQTFDERNRNRLATLGPFSTAPLSAEVVNSTLISYPPKDGETELNLEGRGSYKVQFKSLTSPLIGRKGILSPAHPVTVTGERRRKINVPDGDNMFFCFSYPIENTIETQNALFQLYNNKPPLEMYWVLYGGFVYFQCDQQNGTIFLRGINSLSPNPQSPSMFFDSPLEVSPVSCVRLDFHDVTMEAFNRTGVTKFTWVHPYDGTNAKVDDDFHFPIQTDHGAFAYRYKDEFVHYFPLMYSDVSGGTTAAFDSQAYHKMVEQQKTTSIFDFFSFIFGTNTPSKPSASSSPITPSKQSSSSSASASSRVSLPHGADVEVSNLLASVKEQTLSLQHRFLKCPICLTGDRVRVNIPCGHTGCDHPECGFNRIRQLRNACHCGATVTEWARISVIPSDNQNNNNNNNNDIEKEEEVQSGWFFFK